MGSINGHSGRLSRACPSCFKYPSFFSLADSAGTCGPSTPLSPTFSSPSPSSGSYFTSQSSSLARHQMPAHFRHQHWPPCVMHGKRLGMCGRGYGLKLLLPPPTSNRRFRRPAGHPTEGPEGATVSLLQPRWETYTYNRLDRGRRKWISEFFRPCTLTMFDVFRGSSGTSRTQRRLKLPSDLPELFDGLRTVLTSNPPTN